MELGRMVDSPFCQYQWLMQAADAFAEAGALRVFVARQEDGLVCAIAPLVVSRLGCSRYLTFIGSKQLYEPARFLYRDRKSLDNLVIAVLNYGLPLELNRMPLDFCRNCSFANMARKRGLVFENQESPAIWLPVQGEFKGYENSLSGSRRQRLRRALRHAEKMGVVEFDVSLVSVKQAAEFLRILAEVEAVSWKGEKGSALSQNNTLHGFFENYGAKMAQDGRLVCGVMQLSGHTVAAQMAVISNNVLWILKIGFNQKYAACSPGVLLMHRMVRFAIESRLQAVEFAGHHEQWLEIWSKKVHQYRTIYFFSFNYQGLVFFIVRIASLIRRKFFAKT
jgi:CelD/BcsL family acetyltransferase involved in cellulose biosynthesis